MADEPKPEAPKADQPAPGAAEPAGTNISPAPTEVGATKPGESKSDKPGVAADGKPGNPPASGGGPVVPADPLADGTVPTVLQTGASHRSVSKSKASITSIYRKADIMTTAITFVIAVVVSAVAIGVYAYLTRAKTPTTKAPTVTTLDKSDLDKLGAFFEGDSAGTSSQVLTISASTLFKNRIAASSDVKVSGGVQVTGTTALGDLTVDKTSTLGVTNIRGSLTVAGPSNLQGPVTLGNGLSVTGSLTTTANGSFGGSLSASTISVKDINISGAFNLAGHLSMAGTNPGIAVGPQMGTGATATIDGNDSAGSVTFTTGSTVAAGVQFVTVTFRSPFPRTPKVVITPTNAAAAPLSYYVLKSAGFFIIATPSNASGVTGAAANTNYSFDYWVVQ